MLRSLRCKARSREGHRVYSDGQIEKRVAAGAVGGCYAGERGQFVDDRDSGLWKHVPGRVCDLAADRTKGLLGAQKGSARQRSCHQDRKQQSSQTRTQS